MCRANRSWRRLVPFRGATTRNCATASRILTVSMTLAPVAQTSRLGASGSVPLNLAAPPTPLCVARTDRGRVQRSRLLGLPAPSSPLWRCDEAEVGQADEHGLTADVEPLTELVTWIEEQADLGSPLASSRSDADDNRLVDYPE